MPDNADHLEDGMRRMKIGVDGGDGGKLPERPGEPDCVFYLRTGVCGYGGGCRYNHPAGRAREGVRRGGADGDRAGQADCQYFLRTGTCKFGSSCKYQHPQVKQDARPVSFNILGLPIRQDEKACPYYMRNGSCKFGIACKFNHPPSTAPGSTFPATGPSTYVSTGSSMAPPSGMPLIGGYSPWPLARNPYMSSPGVPNLPAYMPVLPPSQGGMPLQQGWSTYTSTTSHVLSTDFQGSTQMANPKHPVQPGSTVSLNLPERPDQPECMYYMKTGSCKYGNNCKYHHPKDKNSLPNGAMYTLGPLNLPLRPGQPICSFYGTYGVCKYGPACKYDHPMIGYYNYTMAATPYVDPSAYYPSQTSSQVVEMSTEISPSKPSPEDGHIKSEALNGLPNGDIKDQSDHVEITSLTHNSPSSESLGDHSE